MVRINTNNKMKYSILDFGTLKVKASEMIMGIGEQEIREAYKSDEEGYMRIGMNGLVLELADRLILFDPGCGDFLPASTIAEYGLEMDQTVGETVRLAGYSPDEVTDVIFTHLHFDHGTGAFERRRGGIFPVFPNASHLFSRKHFDYSLHPATYERSSFFSKLMRFIDKKVFLEEWQLEGIVFRESNGHTPYMQIPMVKTVEGWLIFITDLAPMRIFLNTSAYSYYDSDYRGVIRERQALLDSISRGSKIVYYHELHDACIDQL